MTNPPDRGPQQLRYSLGRLWLPPLTLVFRQCGWVPPGTADLGTLSQPSPCPSLGFSASSVGGGGAVGRGGPSGCGGVRDEGVESLTSAPLQPHSEWHRPSRGSAVGRLPHPLQAPRGADVSVCLGGLPSSLCVLVAHLALGSPTRHRAGVWSRPAWCSIPPPLLFQAWLQCPGRLHSPGSGQRTPPAPEGPAVSGPLSVVCAGLAGSAPHTPAPPPGALEDQGPIAERPCRRGNRDVSWGWLPYLQGREIRGPSLVQARPPAPWPSPCPF